MGSTDDPSGEPGDPLDRRFSCLAVSERRHLLGHLHDRDPDPVARAELATTFAGRFGDEPPDGVTEADRELALAVLHHVHLPKLEAAGSIEARTSTSGRPIRPSGSSSWNTLPGWLSRRPSGTGSTCRRRGGTSVDSCSPTARPSRSERRGEETDSGVHEERAIVGEGADGRPGGSVRKRRGTDRRTLVRRVAEPRRRPRGGRTRGSVDHGAGTAREWIDPTALDDLVRGRSTDGADPTVAFEYVG